MLFKDIVGQEKVKQKLVKAVKEDRIPHAQLFAGPEGTGKLALAIAYAQFINCKNRQDGDSCNTCPSCVKFNKLIHPDLHFVFPINASKTEDSGDDKGSSTKFCDGFLPQWREQILSNPYFSEQDWYELIGLDNKQGIISTAESSEVIKKLSLKSFEAEFKTMLIWLPERMNQNASNKLLKLIEEPPVNTLFLLVSENPGGVLKTIFSRTQLIKIPPISHESIALALVDRYQLNPIKANEISRISNGNFQSALKLMNADEDEQYFIYFRDLMRFCYRNDVIGLLNWVDDVAKIGREQQKEMLTYFQRLLRESFMLNLQLDDISYLARNEADFGKKFSPYINTKNVYQLYTQFNLAFDHISRNGNPGIIFTDMCMKLVKLIESKK